jgi:hypothetical protein
VEVVKLLADHQKEVRKKAGTNYREVKSKVARCIKIRNKAIKRNKAAQNREKFG